MSLGYVVALLGGWSVIAIAIATFVGKLANERLLSSWRRAEQKELEQVKHVLQENRTLLEKSLGSLASGQDKLYERRAEAANRLWAAMLALREDLSGPPFFYSMLLPEEYMDVLQKGNAIAASVSSLTDRQIMEANEKTKKIEADRPYLGEMLWLRFFIYRAFLSRVAHLIVDGKEKGRIISWREDSGVQQILRNVIEIKPLTEVLGDKRNPSSINMIVQEIENQILKEISLSLTGKRSTLESLEIAKDLQTAVAGLNPFGA